METIILKCTSYSSEYKNTVLSKDSFKNNLDLLYYIANTNATPFEKCKLIEGIIENKF